MRCCGPGKSRTPLGGASGGGAQAAGRGSASGGAARPSAHGRRLADEKPRTSGTRRLGTCVSHSALGLALRPQGPAGPCSTLGAIFRSVPGRRGCHREARGARGNVAGPRSERRARPGRAALSPPCAVTTPSASSEGGGRALREAQRGHCAGSAAAGDLAPWARDGRFLGGPGFTSAEQSGVGGGRGLRGARRGRAGRAGAAQPFPGVRAGSRWPWR